jgi:hypothetical protein
MAKVVKKTNVIAARTANHNDDHNDSVSASHFSTPAKHGADTMEVKSAAMVTPANHSAPGDTAVVALPPVCLNKKDFFFFIWVDNFNILWLLISFWRLLTWCGVVLQGVDIQAILDDMRKLKIIAKGHERRIKYLEERLASYEENVATDDSRNEEEMA